MVRTVEQIWVIMVFHNAAVVGDCVDEGAVWTCYSLVCRYSSIKEIGRSMHGDLSVQRLVQCISAYIMTIGTRKVEVGRLESKVGSACWRKSGNHDARECSICQIIC